MPEVQTTQLRHSDIEALKNRVAKDQYGHYLKEIHFGKLRGLSGCKIRFDFPVTAVVGPNGSGKSTVLGAAGLICRGLAPRTFFARAGSYDTDMKGWSVRYSYLAPDKKSIGNMKNSTASYRQAKWNRDAVDRPVSYVGITRTIPAAERKNLSKFVSGGFVGDSEEPLSEDTRVAVAAILGKNADNYIRVYEGGKVDPEKSVGKTIFAASAPRDNGDDGSSVLAGKGLYPEMPSYSEFHFGAGEASIISIVDEVERAPSESLILIEEIENGLHPVATRRLVEYLVDVAKRKSCQVIFTTHSNDALKPLPSDAVWSVSRGKLYQGKLDIASLRALTGEIDTTCAIFTEDEFSSKLARESLQSYRRELEGETQTVDISQVEIHHLGGEGQVRQHTAHHNGDPTIKFPVIGLLDGDQRNTGTKFNSEASWISEGESIDFRQFTYCPGDGDPERAVYDDVVSAIERKNNLSDPTAKITVALGFPTEDQKRVRNQILEIGITTRDAHLLYARLGEALDFTAADTVERIFIDQWALLYPAKVDEMWGGSKDVLPWRSIEKK